VDFLIEILNKQARLFPIVITVDDANKRKRDFDILPALALLEKTSDPKNIWCVTCHNEDVEVHHVSKDRAYTMCTQNEHAKRDYFNPAEIQQWQFNIENFLSAFQKSMDILSPTISESIDSLLWSLGTQTINGADYHLFFCRDINDIEKPKLSIITHLPRSAVFYTGTPQISLPDKVLLVPIIDLFQKITEKGLFLKKEAVEQFFSRNTYATEDGSIMLDDNLALEKGYLLSDQSTRGVFKKTSEEKLPPLACIIIEHLYGIRKYSQNSKTLSELVTDLGHSKQVISKEIKRISNVCKKNNLPEILHKYTGNKWGINHRLKYSE